MPDDPEHKPFRKTSSEKALAQRWQVEKLLPDFLSEVEKHKGYWNFLEEQKTSLENREKSLKEQIDECIKHQVFEAFKQEVQILLQKKERQVKEKSQEQIEPERFEQMTMQAVKNLLQKAKSNLQTRYQEKGRLISAAVKQIADQVDNPLNQQEGDQRVQEPANQKRDLKEVIESKLKQSLEKLQQSLEEAPLLLDDTRLENDLTGYIKELEKDFQSKLAQMQEREKRLQENNEQFEKMREEEKDIYSGTFLNEPPKDARAKYWNTIQDELLNSIRASEGYRFYDHTAILRYAEAEKQEKIEDIIRSIKNRYLIEKEEVIVLIEDNNHEKCIINKTIGDLVRDSIKEDYKQAKTGVDQAYDHYKMVSAEVSNNDIKHEEAKKETYTAKMCYKNAQTEVFKAYKSYEEAKRKAEQAEEQYKRINEEARRAEEFFMRASAVANEAHVGYEHARVEAHRAEEFFMRASAVANEKYVGYEHARVEAHQAKEYYMRINEEARRAEEFFMRASAVANEAHVRYEHARVEAHRVEEFFMRASAVANETHAGYEHARVEAYRAEEHYMKTCAVANEAYQAIKNIEEKHVNYKQSIKQFEDAYSYTKVSYHNKIEALQMMNESIKRRALAEKELEAAERKLRDQYESLINALRHKKAQLQIIFRNTEKETNDIYSMPTNNNCLNNKSIYNEIGTKENLRYTKRYIDSLEKYEKSLIELQDKYNKYDETVEKVKTAEVLSENMKNMIKKNNQIYTEEQKIQEEIEKFDKRINEIKDYQKKLKNVKEVIYNITYKESLKLNEMEILGKEANEFNNILKEPAKVGIKRYQELDRMGEDILEMEKELEKKEEKALHIQNKLKDIKDEIFQIESDINYKKTQQENLKINIQTTRKEYKYLERKKTTIKKDDLSQFKGNSDEQINRLVSLQEHIRKIKFDMDKYSDLTIQNLIKDRNEMAEIINMVQDIFTEYMKYEQNYKNNFGEKTSKEDLRRYYDELKMNIQEFFTEYKTKRKKVEKSINNLKVVISSPKGNNKECIESLYKEICTLKAQYENLDKEKHDLEAKFEEKRKEKHELEAKLKIPINLHINESELNFKKARLKEINGTIEIKNEKLTMYKNAVCTVYNDNIEQLKEARFLYDDTIVAGLKFQNVAESLCKTEEQEYSKEKARFLEEITRKIEEQNNEKIILQLKLDTTKKEIASKEAELSSKQEDRRSLQEELATIDREMEQLAKEIEVQKKEKEKLCDEAKDRVLSEAKFMRIKKSITDLALEKIAQIYDLALQDTKVPRVSPAVTGRIAQETVMPEAPRETQEAQGIPGQQAGPLAPRGHEDDFTSESSSDDELVVPFNRHEQVSAEDYIKNRFLEYGLIGENMRNASMEEIMRRIPFQDHMEKVITWEAQKRKA